MKTEKFEIAPESETEYLTPDPLAPKRNGKIARLPRDIREALNRQLKENFHADDILEWLNAVPAVKAVLDKEFAGQPISRQNLAHWRPGGYREWANQRCAYAQLQARQKEITQKGGNPYQLGYEMAQIHAAEYLATLADVVATAPNAQARMKGLSKAMMEFRGWRRADDHAQHMALQTERMALDKENAQWRREHETQELALKNKKLDLDREKFERTHIEEIVRICKKKTVREIAQDEEKNYTEKIKAIRVIMFGDEDELEEGPESGVPSPESGESEGNGSTAAIPGEPATSNVEPPNEESAGLANVENAHVANQPLASSEAVKVSQKDEPVGDESMKGGNANAETPISKHQAPKNHQQSTTDPQLAGEAALPELTNLQPSTCILEPQAEGSLTIEQAEKVVEEWRGKAGSVGIFPPGPGSFDYASLKAYLSGEPAPWYNLNMGKAAVAEPPSIDPRRDPTSRWYPIAEKWELFKRAGKVS